MKKSMLCFLLLITFGCMVLGGCSNGSKEYQKILSEEEIEQLQKEQYPLISPGSMTLADMSAGTLERRIETGPIAVVEFIEQLPMIEDKYIPGEGTSEAILAEKWGIDYYTFYYPSYKFRTYKFRIVETLTGEIPSYLIGEDQTVTISLSAGFFEEALPNFRPGEQYITMVGESEDGGQMSKQFNTAWFDPFCVFYVTDKEYVLSATAEENFQKYSGYRLNDFEGILQEMERNPSEQVSE